MNNNISGDLARTQADGILKCCQTYARYAYMDKKEGLDYEQELQSTTYMQIPPCTFHWTDLVETLKFLAIGTFRKSANQKDFCKNNFKF